MTLSEDIANAVAAMRCGGVIVYPTDTVWGIGCDARSPEAVRKVFAIKHRADSKALITLVSSVEMLGRHTCELSDDALTLATETDRPVTVVYPRGRDVATELMADDGSIGIRLTREEVSAALCDALGAPVVSTSANISGQPAAGCFADIDSRILEAADYVMLARRDDTTPAQPSKVVKLLPDGTIKILRP